MSSLKHLPEIRGLFAAGREYLAGKVSLQHLNGLVRELGTLAKAGQLSPAMIVLLDEWAAMINRRWNEWSLERHPLTEEEFTTWLREQIVLDDRVFG